MERLTNRNIKAYDYLAKYYDAILSDEEAFSLWLKEIESEKFESVLELASGSGIMAKILKNKGYQIIASDISESMKNAAKENYDGDYLIIDMRNYDINQKFDLIICICDSINYLEENELDDFFKCAYKHLKTNGRLIFDTHNLKRLEEFKEEYIEENSIEDIDYQWTILSDPITKTINEHFTFYTDDGMIQEQHVQHVFDTEMLKTKMNAAGFKTKEIVDFVLDEKILMIGRK